MTYYQQSKMKYIMGYDIGSSSTKAIIVDLDGHLLSSFNKAHPIIAKKKGYQEHEKDLYLRELKEVIEFFRSQDPSYIDNLSCIGFTGIIPAMCLVTKDAKLISNVILHSDTRAEEELLSINKRYNLSHSFMLSKILWYKKRKGFKDVYKIMCPHNFLSFYLTKKATMDYDGASMIGALLNDDLTWNKQVMKSFDLDDSLFADLKSANNIIGTIDKERIDELNLNENTKVITGVGDTFTSLLGGGALDKEHLMLYLGTSSTLVYANTRVDEYIDKPHYQDNRASFIANVFSFGQSIEHFKELTNITIFDNLNKHLLDKNDEDLFYIVHQKGSKEDFFAFDSDHLLGLRIDHSPVDIYRAIIESLAFNIKKALKSFDKKISRFNVLGGGAKSENSLKIIASILNMPLSYNKKSSTALGIAVLSYLATSQNSNFIDIKEKWLKDYIIIKPDKALVKFYKNKYKKYEKIKRALDKLR